MKHLSPNEFAAAPQRGHGRRTELAMTRQLQQRLRPADRARADAQLLDTDPRVLAHGFLDEVEHSRAEHYAVVRSETLSSVVANTDAIGVLTVSATVDQAEHCVRDAETALDRVDTERRKDALRAMDLWERGLAAYKAWADRSGAKPATAPWATASYAVLTVVAFSLGETWVGAEVLAGPPIVGVPAPFVLGLFFAFASLFTGALAALGHMLAADARAPLRLGGWAVLVLAALLWFFVCLCGAHMRASIEGGGSGTIPEIAKSLEQGAFTPLLSPMSLLLTAASSLTAAGMWIKLVGYFGVPFGHRGKDEARRWCVRQLDEAEDAHKADVRGAVAQAVDDLGELAAEAARPTRDAAQLEREIQVMLAEARESERAIDRGHKSLLTGYGTTFARIRSGTDFVHDLTLVEVPAESLHDPASLRPQVEALRQSADLVAAACDRGTLRLHQAEVSHLAKVDALYGETRRRHVGRDLTPLS